MNKSAAALVFAAASWFSVGLSAADRGLPARSAPGDYPVQATDKGVTIAAELMDPEQVKGSFATDLAKYAVVEVAVFPNQAAAPIDLSIIDFALRIDGRMVRPANPRSIARINQKRSADRSRDVTLYPNVGVQTGSWGTGTAVGVGVGLGGNSPGPASSDRDREVMEMELEDKGLPEALVSKPVAGYLYFPIGSSKKKDSTYQLEYQLDGVDVKLTLPR